MDLAVDSPQRQPHRCPCTKLSVGGAQRRRQLCIQSSDWHSLYTEVDSAQCRSRTLFHGLTATPQSRASSHHLGANRSCGFSIHLSASQACLSRGDLLHSSCAQHLRPPAATQVHDQHSGGTQHKHQKAVLCCRGWAWCLSLCTSARSSCCM